ncbi:MAG TPA: hypothetical protein VFD93_07625, partial [Candidatus Acidoferrales bacterium]|nr:hypothetical protein [Candidatus Acidoferrales bacterium]
MNSKPRMSRRFFLRASSFAGAAAFAGGLTPLREWEPSPSNVAAGKGAAQSSAASGSVPNSLDEWIERIFSREFAGKRFGPARWDEDGKSYTVLESAHGNREAQELARYDSASGER